MYSTGIPLLLLFVVASQSFCSVKGSSSTSWLSQCTAEGHGELKQLYVSTLDGRLTAMSSLGRRQWRYKFTQPLYSSSLSYTEPSSQFPNLIPGLDKKLYHWDGAYLSPLALSVEDLLWDGTGQPEIIRVGGKMKEDVALDVATGKPLYHCTHSSCHKYDNQSHIGQMDRLLVSAHRTTVREANSLSGEELWNFTVSRLQLSLLEGEVSANEDISCLLADNGASDWILNVDASQGILFVSNRHAKLSWDYTFPAPIMDVWLHQGGKLEKISLTPLHHSTEAVRPSLLLGVWHNQYYIQPTVDSNTPAAIPHWIPPHYLGGVNHYGNKLSEACDLTSDHLSYVPVVPSDFHGNNGPMMLYNQQDNWINELSTLGPNGLALYFHPIDSGSDQASCYSRELENTSDDETIPMKQQSTVEMEDNPESFLTKLLEYGRNALQYTVFAVIVLAVNKLRRYHMQQRRIRNSNSSDSSGDSTEDDEVFRLSDDLGANGVIPPAFRNSVRHSSSSSTIKPSQTYDLLPILEEDNSVLGIGGEEEGPAVFPSSHFPIASQSSESVNENVGSRFETEYESLGVLGKGGFGVVYHVKNRTDNIEYALKRIKLPEKPSAREKVMREVHALAQLDHPNIVRYFNSWVEKAPPGWDKREEWISLSRVNSQAKMDELSWSSKPSNASLGHASFASSNQSQLTTSSYSATSNESHTHSDTSPLSLSSIQSMGPFSPELPPLRSGLTSSDSQSSFTIEFRDDSQSALNGHMGDDNSAHFSNSPVHRPDSPVHRPDSPISISSIGSGIRRSSYDTTGSHGNGIRINVSDSNEQLPSKEESLSVSFDIRPHPKSATPSFVFIQMQLCQKESLRDWLKKNVNNRPRIRVLEMFEQMLNAVVYVHEQGLMHRDLKPSNIFFSLDGRVKVGDFGLVTGHVTPDTHNNSFNVLTHLGQSEPDDSGRHTGNIGTHFYVSPEQMMGLKYDQKVDVFSLGVILFEMIHPFTTEMERAKVLEDLRKTKFPVNFKKQLYQEAVFVEWLMSPVSRRPTAHEVFKSGRVDELRENVNNLFIPKL